MNLSEIVANVKAELHPATNIDTIIRRWANRGQKKFVSMAEVNFSWMTLNDLILATAVGQSEYVLSPLVDTSKLITIRDPERLKKIDVISRHEFQALYPDPTLNSGEPEVAYLSGYSAVATQPTSLSTITCTSTAADTAVVKIEGIGQYGVLIGEEITLNGTTPVASVHQYEKILSRSINGFLNGTLFIASNGGSVPVDVVSPRLRQGLYPKIILYPTPATDKGLPYDATMLLPDIVNNNDMSWIPEKYHDAIEDYCLYRGYRHKKDLEMSQEAKQSFRERILDAVRDDQGPSREIQVGGPDRVPYLGNGRFPGLYPRNY